MNIVHVEDNLGDIFLVSEALDSKASGINIIVYSDGEAACRYFTGHDGELLPDLIILDLNLPRLSGLELLEVIKKNETLRHIPVVIFTSSNSETDKLQASRLGAKAFFTKSMDFDLYIEQVKEFMNLIAK